MSNWRHFCCNTDLVMRTCVSLELGLHVLHTEQWPDFLVLIKLQTCHPDQHSEKASEKNSLTPNVRGTAQNSTCTNEGNNKLHNSHSLGEIIPGVASHLSLYFSIKSLISGASSQNTVSSSGDLPPTNSQLMLVLSQPVAQAVGESLFVLLPTEGMKHKVTLPISL